jgi:hypothetical protein
MSGSFGLSSGTPFAIKKRSPAKTLGLGFGPTETILHLGPARSINKRHSRPRALAADLTFLIIPAQTVASSWAQLIRTQSAPADSKSFASSGSVEASLGSVTMTRVYGPAGSGPNTARFCCSAPALLSWLPFGGKGAGFSSATLERVAMTESSDAKTRPSLRPSEDSPRADNRG